MLLDVVDISLAGMSPEFLSYDTDHGTFPLPKKGEYLMLIFLKLFRPYDGSVGTNLFTTLRRSTPKKREYYRNENGKVFDVVFVEGEP